MLFESCASTNCLSTSSVITRPVGVTNTCGLVTCKGFQRYRSVSHLLLPSPIGAPEALRIVSTGPAVLRPG